MKRFTAMIFCLALSVGMVGCAGQTNDNNAEPPVQQETEAAPETQEPQENVENVEMVFDEDTLIVDVMNDPVFAGYGQFLFPTQSRTPDEDMTLSDVGELFPMHGADNIDVTQSVNTLNAMQDRAESGTLTFYDIYTDEEKADDPRKEDTGVFFFRGDADAPFAVINAEGGFSYVASLHAAFPYALDLNERGYNAFVLQYRTGGLDVAVEDLARAISFIFEHAEEIGVSTENYSLWGGSAGGQMVARLSSYGAAEFGGDDLPAATAIIMQYTAYQDYTGNEPATFACIGENDSMSSPTAMQTRIENLKNAGIETEFHIYPGLDHGWGYGQGTSAEGWMEDAVAFWERQMD